MGQTATLPSKPQLVQIDYSLVGVHSTMAIERRLAEADWYQSPVPHATMRRLLERRDGPAIRDTILWFCLHFVAHNPNTGQRNNYSLASNQNTERVLRFNVRIATPPPGQSCAPGVGSSYLFSLKPGDRVTAKSTDFTCFTPEVLNPEIYYARVFPDAAGQLVEESDRWQQSLLLANIAEDCFAEALPHTLASATKSMSWCAQNEGDS